MKKFFLTLTLVGTVTNLNSMEPSIQSRDSEGIKTQAQWMHEGCNALDDRKPDLLEQALQHIVEEQSKFQLLFSALQRWNDDRQLIISLSGLFRYLTDPGMREDIRGAAEKVLGCGLDTLHGATSPRRERPSLLRRPSSVSFGEAAVIEADENVDEPPTSMEEALEQIRYPALQRITRQNVARHTPPNSMKGRINPRLSKSP